MIDPTKFVNISKQDQKIGVNVTGTFICQDCMEPIGFGTLDEDNMVITYVCAAGHSNEAKL